jgi:tetratricopeptide (TPR) repeat protein
VALLAPHETWVRSHAEVEQQWEYWAATALALDYADRLGDAMPAWETARAVAEKAERRDMVWKTMSNAASTQAKMGLVAQAAQAAEQAHRLARAANEPVTQRVLQMQVTLAHRLRDVGRFGDALALLEEALAGYRATGASHSDHALAEQRLVVLYQQLGQPARAQHLLAPERPGVPRGVAMIRLAHRAELESQLGRDGLAMMREALKIIPNADDIFHRITTLFATRLVPADEGEAMAANLALWATARERHGVALSAMSAPRPARSRSTRRRAPCRTSRRRCASPGATCPTASTCRRSGWWQRAPWPRSAATLRRARHAPKDAPGSSARTTPRCRMSSAKASCAAIRSTASCWRCRSPEPALNAARLPALRRSAMLAGIGGRR